MEAQSLTVKCNGKDITIHAIQAGLVAVKTAHRSNQGPGFMSPVLITLEKQFTEYMPIWTWVIEHSEGIIVIDTGENAGVMKPGYFRPAGKIVAAYNKKISDSGFGGTAAR